jgi:hypothetical protein
MDLARTLQVYREKHYKGKRLGRGDEMEVEVRSGI